MHGVEQSNARQKFGQPSCGERSRDENPRASLASERDALDDARARNNSSHADDFMSSFVRFNFSDLGTPCIGAPLPERVVEGAQVFKTWEIDYAEGGDVRTGVWEVTPGAYRCIKDTTWELCIILSGVSEITEDGKEPVTVRAGDTFVLKPGFEGTWRCIETTRKLWVSKN
jgi:uncharacterized protein